jgi:hypothetical protein
MCKLRWGDMQACSCREKAGSSLWRDSTDRRQSPSSPPQPHPHPPAEAAMATPRRCLKGFSILASSAPSSASGRPGQDSGSAPATQLHSPCSACATCRRAGEQGHAGNGHAATGQRRLECPKQKSRPQQFMEPASIPHPPAHRSPAARTQRVCLLSIPPTAPPGGAGGRRSTAAPRPRPAPPATALPPARQPPRLGSSGRGSGKGTAQ